MALFFALALILVQVPGTDAAIGKESMQVISIEGCHLYYTIGTGDLSVGRAALAQYVRDAARAVIAYYGYFPVSKVVIHFELTDDDGVGYGSSTFNDDKGTGEVDINIGESTTRSQLKESWTLTHELMHLGFPVVSHHARWLAEGIATYVEPIGRMRIGNISKEEVWGDLLRNLHKGLPRQGERGLHSSRSFDRVYWGGALFCLLADVEIRQRTKNHLGLEDALRSIAKQGGTAASNWDAEEAIIAGDKGLGVTVLRSLYTTMADKPVSIDVVAYLRKLGVEKAGSSVRFNDSAPLAAVRRAIDGLD